MGQACTMGKSAAPRNSLGVALDAPGMRRMLTNQAACVPCLHSCAPPFAASLCQFNRCEPPAHCLRAMRLAVTCD